MNGIPKAEPLVAVPSFKRTAKLNEGALQERASLNNIIIVIRIGYSSS